MSRLLKTLALALAGIVLLIVLSAVALKLFFDPNDFRDDIAARVEAATGRELVIEGDLSVSLFPWLAVEVGRTRLGNAAGFGDEPFAEFESARLSVRLLPLLLRREIAVGTAALDSLQLNLVTNAEGTNNWDDLAQGETAPADEPADEAGEAPGALDVAGVEVSNASVRLRDLGAGSDYRVDALSLTTGRIALGEPFEVDAEFDFALQPEDLSGELAFAARVTIDDAFETIGLGDLALDGEVAGIASRPAAVRLAAPRLTVDLAGSRLEPAELELAALGVEVDADVAAFSWADAPTGEARIEVAEFSPRDIAGLLDIELPPTADPQALTRVGLAAVAELDTQSLSLEDLRLVLDDTTMQGEIVLPLGTDAPLRFQLSADTLDLDRYMAPASAAPAAEEAGAGDDFEIPVELIRSVNARGTLELAQATLSGMQFTNVELGLTGGGGTLRLNPLSAELFDGSYSGDIRIDAAGATPALSANERVSGVSLQPLAQAMFERDNITGTIDGSFVLTTRGETLATMRRQLNGNMTFELADGAWQGVDLWYQLRAARALYRREPPPEARTPARTEFSSVLATGTVTDGVFRNEDLVAEMPFLRLTGSGTVDLAAGGIDFALRARVLERPEFLRGASDEELAEFTEALIPVRISGQLTDPKVRPDIEAMFKDEVDNALKKKGDELKQRLLDRLVPSAPADEGEEAADGEQDGDAGDPEDQIKDQLKKLFEQ